MRKNFATSIDSNISDAFKKACDEYDLKMNVVLEALMKDFSEGNYSIIMSRNSGITIKRGD